MWQSEDDGNAYECAMRYKNRSDVVSISRRDSQTGPYLKMASINKSNTGRDLPPPRSLQPLDRNTYSRTQPTPIPINPLSSTDTSSQKSLKKWIFALAALTILSVILIIASSTLQSLSYQKLTAPTMQNKKASSCKELIVQGITNSGVHFIKPESDFKEIEAYCDMETDGGGWTLVASIHESDITKKCDVKDRWSNYIPNEGVDYFGINIVDLSTEKSVSLNWENKRVFGEVKNCTFDDYKNSAYFALNAKDVMIWHVSSETPINNIESRAHLRYRTANNFLQQAGGNLKSLFSERYPLRKKNGYNRVISIQRSELVIKALEQHSETMRKIIPYWYTYHYAHSGNINNNIEDSRMYNGNGNKV
ncbi:intelectin-2-like [Styela clava]